MPGHLAQKRQKREPSHDDQITLDDLDVPGVQRLDVSFSKATFQEIAPYVWLDPLLGGQDILHLDIFRSRIPNSVFREICEDVDKATRLYGPIHSHDNEEARSRFIASLFTTIVSLFGGYVINKLEGDFTRDGRIVHHFSTLNAISIVFIEVKRTLTMGKQRLDTKAQVLAECAACDQHNRKQGICIPILAILCDGLNFEYLVYDAAEKQVHSSGLTIGITANEVGGSTELLISLKKTTEYLMDWFLMGYLNTIGAFWSECSSRDTETRKRRHSTGNWSESLVAAERAHALLQQAAKAASDKRYTEAESMATSGFEKIRESVAGIPYRKPSDVRLAKLWDGKCIEESLEQTM